MNIVFPERRPQSATSSLSRLLVALIVIDLLFLPRMGFAFNIPASLLIVIASLLNLRFQAFGVLCFLLLASSIFLSVTIGGASQNGDVAVDSFKRALQLATMLLYAFYWTDLKSVKSLLVGLLRIFSFWMFGFVLLFFLDPDLYESLLSRIYPEALGEFSSNLLYRRFPYIFSDPNSAGYFACLVLITYLALEHSRSWIITCATLLSLVVIATQSRGAYIILVIAFVHQLMNSEVRVRVRVATLVSFGLIAVALAVFYSDQIEQAYSVFEVRLTREEGIGGGRAEKYAYFLQNLNLLPFGSGYSLVREGAEFRPHSDLIRLNLAYGILAIPLLLYFVFPRRKSQLILFFAFVVPFLINSIIDDYRLLPTYLLFFMLLAQHHPKSVVASASLPPQNAHLGARGTELYVDHRMLLGRRT